LSDTHTTGGSLWDGGNATGQIILSAGAEAYIDNGSIPVIGQNAGARLNLADGTITLKANGYVLDGNATLQQDFGLSDMVLAIKANKKFIINSTGTTKKLYMGGSGIVTGEAGASIEIVTGSSIDFTTNGGTSNFYATATTASPTNPVNTAGTYNWNPAAGGGVGGWVKQ
jgi:hypothetical protein